MLLDAQMLTQEGQGRCVPQNITWLYYIRIGKLQIFKHFRIQIVNIYMYDLFLNLTAHQ